MIDFDECLCIIGATDPLRKICMQRLLIVFGFFIVSTFAVTARAQNQSLSGAKTVENAPSQGDSALVSADYPRNRAGVLILEKDWVDVVNQAPSKTKVAHGLAAGLSYGLAPAKIVAEYQGEHSSTVIGETQPVLCICHFSALPGAPALVRLHAKKDLRELNGGKMTIYPIVGGSKTADANKTDLIAADVSQPQPQVWLIRPHEPLEPGEYALMLGTQNLNIFPFTVETAAAPASH
jgi:hypothetical protein